MEQPAEAVATPAPQPKVETVTYPITKVVDGKVHSISAFPSGELSTSLLLVERIAPAQVNLQQTFDYIINVTNISKNTLHDVSVTEPYSAIFKYQSSDPAPSSHKEGTLVWDLGDLEAQETKSITVKGSPTQGGRISDCVTVNYTPRACIEVEVVDPKLQLIQTGPKTVIQCDPIPITLTVKNNGTGIARNVMVEEKLPNGLKTLDGKSVIVARAGDLKPGEAKTVKVSLKAADVGKYNMQAQANAQGNLKSSAAYAVTVVNPKLVMTKTGPEKRFAGRFANYEITVTNEGDGQAKNLVITDEIPTGATFVSATDGGKLSNGKVTWNLGSLAPDASQKVSLRVKLDKIGTVENKAVAKAECASASAKCITQVNGIAAILLEVVDLDDPIELDESETYVISVTNQGSAIGTNIRIVATLPAEMEYISSTGPTQASVSGKVVTFAPLPRLAPKAKVQFKVDIKGVKTGDLRFHVQLKSDQMTTPVMETESTHVY